MADPCSARRGFHFGNLIRIPVRTLKKPRAGEFFCLASRRRRRRPQKERRAGRSHLSLSKPTGAELGSLESRRPIYRQCWHRSPLHPQMNKFPRLEGKAFPIFCCLAFLCAFIVREPRGTPSKKRQGKKGRSLRDPYRAKIPLHPHKPRALFRAKRFYSLFYRRQQREPTGAWHSCYYGPIGTTRSSSLARRNRKKFSLFMARSRILLGVDSVAMTTRGKA